MPSLSEQDRQHMRLLQHLHNENPQLTAEQLTDMLEKESGKTPSEYVLRAVTSLFDPYAEAREIIKFKSGRR
jgi:hypothetical protein